MLVFSQQRARFTLDPRMADLFQQPFLEWMNPSLFHTSCVFSAISSL